MGCNFVSGLLYMLKPKENFSKSLRVFEPYTEVSVHLLRL